MSHRVALYHIRIRPPRKLDDFAEFGDYDGQGKWLGELLKVSLASVQYKSKDGTFIADFDQDLTLTKKDCVGAVFTSGRGGVTSTLRAAGKPDYRRTKGHREVLRTGVLLELPRNKKLGRLLVHSAHGHGVKVAVEEALRRDVKNIGMFLDIEPVVDVAVLQQAARQGKIDKVTLVKYNHQAGDGFDELAQWGADNEVGKIGLVVPSRRDAKLKSDPLRKFLDAATPENRAAMLEFRGARFDDAEITVDIPGGQRTFALGEPSKGYAWSEVVEVEETTPFGGSAASIAAALQKSL